MISFFKKKPAKSLPRLPAGSFTLDRQGRIVVSTLPNTFSEAQLRDIGGRVLEFFRGAQKARLPLQELNIHYPNLKLTARNLSGGALIFLLPQTQTKTESL